MSDPQQNLEWFVGELRDEITDLEDWIGAKFNNPAVVDPARHCEFLTRELINEWDWGRASEAITAGLYCFVGAYKTGAGHQILMLRNVIASRNLNEESLPYKHHVQARQHFGLALELFRIMRGQSGLELVKTADKCVAQFCRALGVATRGIDAD